MYNIFRWQSGSLHCIWEALCVMQLSLTCFVISYLKDGAWQEWRPILWVRVLDCKLYTTCIRSTHNQGFLFTQFIIKILLRTWGAIHFCKIYYCLTLWNSFYYWSWPLTELYSKLGSSCGFNLNSTNVITEMYNILLKQKIYGH